MNTELDYHFYNVRTHLITLTCGWDSLAVIIEIRLCVTNIEYSNNTVRINYIIVSNICLLFMQIVLYKVLNII